MIIRLLPTIEFYHRRLSRISGCYRHQPEIIPAASGYRQGLPCKDKWEGLRENKFASKGLCLSDCPFELRHWIRIPSLNLAFFLYLLLQMLTVIFYTTLVEDSYTYMYNANKSIIDLKAQIKKNFGVIDFYFEKIDVRNWFLRNKGGFRMYRSLNFFF